MYVTYDHHCNYFMYTVEKFIFLREFFTLFIFITGKCTNYIKKEENFMYLQPIYYR